jgi:hypothetical protein
MLTYQFALDYKDCSAYIETCTVETLKLQPKKSKVILYSVYGFILLYLFFSEYSKGEFPSAMFLSLSIFVVVMAFITIPRKNEMSFVYKKNSETQTKVFINNPDNESFFRNKTYVVSHTGIEIVSTTSVLKYSWSAFIKRKDTATHIFLFLDQITVVVFPKSKIAALPEFESILNHQISFHAEIGRDINV